MEKKVISLFTGAGGLDIGFENAGFDISVAIESDSACCLTLRRNRPHLKLIESKIEDVSSKDILSFAGLKPLEAALVIGGPPCQPFSLAGSRKGLKDPRGKLLMEFVRVVRDILPRGFVLENVRGLLNWDNGKAKDLLMKELAEPVWFKGKKYQYDIKVDLLNACDYGVPQSRERVFFIGNRIGVQFNFPEPSHTGKYRTVWDAIAKLPTPEEPSETAKMVAQSIRGRIGRHGY